MTADQEAFSPGHRRLVSMRRNVAVSGLVIGPRTGDDRRRHIGVDHLHTVEEI
jgi:hypothetical protein